MPDWMVWVMFVETTLWTLGATAATVWFLTDERGAEGRRQSQIKDLEASLKYERARNDNLRAELKFAYGQNNYGQRNP